MKRRYIFLYSAAIAALAIYYLFSIYLLPRMYLSLPEVTASPVLRVNMSSSVVKVGDVFTLAVAGDNQGDKADIQIISVAFPNLTSTKGVVHIKNHDFSHNPVFIEVGEQIGSSYAGLEKPVSAKYPSVEFYGRPWYPHETHSLQIEVTPDKVGRFVIFVKSVALPHTTDLANFPRAGIRDHQQEFVEVYFVMVQP